MNYTQLLLLALVSLPGSFMTKTPPPTLFCTTTLQGRKTKFEIPLSTTPLEEGIRDWNLDIPSPSWKCPEIDSQVGVMVKVCDADKPPVIIHEMFNGAFVHRTGLLQGKATVEVKAFCAKVYVLYGVQTSPLRSVTIRPLQ